MRSGCTFATSVYSHVQVRERTDPYCRALRAVSSAPCAAGWRPRARVSSAQLSVSGPTSWTMDPGIFFGDFADQQHHSLTKILFGTYPDHPTNSPFFDVICVTDVMPQPIRDRSNRRQKPDGILLYCLSAAGNTSSFPNLETLYEITSCYSLR